MAVDGQFKVGVVRSHLRAGQIEKALNGGKRYRDVVLDRSVPALLALGDSLAEPPHCGPLRSALRQQASSIHPDSIASARTASISSSRSRWREEDANSTRTGPAGPARREGGSVIASVASAMDLAAMNSNVVSRSADSRRTNARSSASGAPFASFSHAVARRAGKGARRNTAPVTMPRVPSLPTKHSSRCCSSAAYACRRPPCRPPAPPRSRAADRASSRT